MKLFSKIVMMGSSLSIIAGNRESFSCCLEQLFFKNLAPVSAKRNSAGDVASGVFKTRKAIEVAVCRSAVC